MWVCGGQIVIGTGVYVGVWWTDCYRDRFICGCVVDRLLQGQVYMWVCGGQIVIGTGLYVGVWWTDCYRDRYICGCVVDRLL